MTIDKIYRLIADFTSKVVGGYISPTQFNDYAEMACVNVMRKYFPQTPEALRFATTERVSNDLNALKKVAALTTNVSGQITTPADYYNVLKITATATGDKIDVVEIYQEDDRVGSALLPTSTGKIAVNYINFFQIHPIANNVAITFVYIKKPATPVYAYTVVSGRPVYDSGSSVQHEFQNMAEIDFMQEIIKFVAPHLKDADLLQFSNVVKQEHV